jgi:hypothetical protein
MSAWKFQQESILKVITKDGPIWREMMKPPIKFVKHKDYGVRKLAERLGKKSRRVR